jgi:hypothetical protein
MRLSFHLFSGALTLFFCLFKFFLKPSIEFSSLLLYFKSQIFIWQD